MIATTCRAALLATCATFLGAGALSAQELQYWVYSDFAQGDALKLQEEFIAEFEAKNPGVKIVISGRGDDDLTSGQIAGAASGTIPDVFMNGLAVGAQLVEVGALANIYPEWMAMPQEFRDQFDAAAIASCTPEPEKMYCLPYTGFGEIMYRNLTVLEAAGIDTATPPATYEEWLAQMVKVKDSGKFAIPDQTQVFNSVASMYAVRGDKAKWGIDFDKRQTLIDPASMTRTMQMFIDMEPLQSGSSRNDQATKDLFITNQLAFHEVDAAKRGTAMVFQSYALYPHMTVAENMGFGLKMAGESKAVIREKVTQAASILRLEQLLDRRPGQLSGGQKQRVAISRAIVRKPKVFLFDEPLSNLDAELRVQMRSELIELHRRLGATMIYVTHDQVEAMTLADRIVVMNGGVVQQYGRPLDLYDDPDNRFVAGFIGSPKMNFLDASVGDTGPDRVTLTSIGGSGYSLKLPFRGFDAAVRKVVLGVRPEHVRLATDAAEGLPVKVSFAEELGDVTYVHGKSADGNSLIMRSDRARHDGAETCAVTLDPAGLRLFDAGGRRLRESGT